MVSFTLLPLIASIHITTGISCCEENTCLFSDRGNTGYGLDLSAFSCHTLQYKKQDYNFIYTPCGNRNNCKFNDNIITGMMIESNTHKNHEFCTKIAEWDYGNQPKYDRSLNEWIFEYNNGDNCFGDPRRFTIVWRCNKNEHFVKIIDIDETTNCHYIMILETKYACISSQYSKLKCELDINKPLSNGSICIIIFVVCIISYCCIGYIIIAMTKNKANGFSDFNGNIPNLSFWVRMFKYVLTGCCISYEYIMYLKSKIKTKS
eukprot:130997_1